MKQVILAILFALFIDTLSAYLQAHSNQTGQFGSFSMNPTTSFDGKYIASIEKNESMIGIRISDFENSEEFYFEPVRKLDFWGVCWETDTYNLWIQSGDVVVICYRFEDGIWILDPDAKRPAYIFSKYDD
jgi:hypothetical protein